MPSELPTTQRTLPDYENPPAQETWMSFRFAPLKWDIPHFGAFWNEIRTDYPNFEVHPPLGEFSVEVDAMRPEAVLKLPVRCWFISQQSNRLLQIQSTRFYHNWRKGESSDKYFHYADLKPHFQREWNRFRDFVAKHELGQITVLGSEVTYVNHLERGRGWSDFSDLERVFPNVGNFHGRDFLGKPETVSFRSAYVMAENEGRLQLEVQPVVRQTDGKEILQFSVTGSCRPVAQADSDLFGALDLSRAWVVRGFDDFTSELMHELWGKKRWREQ